jgi:hypothetical protein
MAASGAWKVKLKSGIQLRNRLLTIWRRREGEGGVGLKVIKRIEREREIKREKEREQERQKRQRERKRKGERRR